MDLFNTVNADIFAEFNKVTLAVDENRRAITLHDYIVKKVARRLDSVSVAIKKVTVRG